MFNYYLTVLLIEQINLDIGMCECKYTANFVLPKKDYHHV